MSNQNVEVGKGTSRVWHLLLLTPFLLIGGAVLSMLVWFAMMAQSVSVAEAARATNVDCLRATEYAQKTPGQTIVPEDMLMQCAPFHEENRVAEHAVMAKVVARLKAKLGGQEAVGR